jgi:cell division septation protein DedD
MEEPTKSTATRPVTLEHRFRNGEVGIDALAIEREATTDPEPGAARSSRSESFQELGASVLLVGLLLIVLMVSGYWGPAVEIPGRSSRDASRGSAAEIDPAPPPRELPPINAGASIDPKTPLPQARRRVPEPPIIVPEPVAAGRPVYGFEVAAYDHADSAAAVLQRITRKSKLPVRVVTRSSGDRYRVVVGPFPRRRDAEKAIHELFRSALVERARLVQITE